MARPRPRRPAGPRVGENPRPPRYRLLAAAAAIPQRSARPSESFVRSCPACGRAILFTQVETAEGTDYVLEDHDCGTPSA